MMRRTTLSLAFVALAAPSTLLLPSGAAFAQDAAESAILLGGSGTAQARAQRSLGSAIARSMGGAANAIRATSRAMPVHARHNARRERTAIAIPGHVDPLEGTDAPTYRLENGASIRVSGGLRPGPQAACASGCPVQAPAAHK